MSNEGFNFIPNIIEITLNLNKYMGLAVIIKKKVDMFGC